MTRTSKHTPGPWHVDVEAIAGTEDAGIVIRDQHGYRVAETYTSAPHVRDGAANARLIAKAPEMRALLTRLATVDADARTTIDEWRNCSRVTARDARALLAELDA